MHLSPMKQANWGDTPLHDECQQWNWHFNSGCVPGWDQHNWYFTAFPVSGSPVLFLTYYTQAMATAEELRSIASPLSPWEQPVTGGTSDSVMDLKRYFHFLLRCVKFVLYEHFSLIFENGGKTILGVGANVPTHQDSDGCWIMISIMGSSRSSLLGSTSIRRSSYLETTSTNGWSQAVMRNFVGPFGCWKWLLAFGYLLDVCGRFGLV